MADVMEGGPAAANNAPPPVVRVADPLGQEVGAWLYVCICVDVGGRGEGGRGQAANKASARATGAKKARRLRGHISHSLPPTHTQHKMKTGKQVRAHFATFLQECRPPGNEDEGDPPLYLFRLTQVRKACA